MENSCSDRRAEERFECHKRASVLFGGRMLDGILRSISLSGARLELPNPPYGLPSELDLYIQNDATCYPVRIVWQSGERFGVIFSSATRPDPEICLQHS
jgi:PilZ domain-containing protein